MLNGIMALVALLVAFNYAGPSGIETVSCEVSAELTPYSLELHVDPIFLVWGDAPCSAMTFANVIVMDESLRGGKEEAYILHHELNHVRQYQALGALWYPASLVLPMESWPGKSVQWDRPAQNDEVMWLPPAWLHTWHFFTLSVRLG